MRRALDHSYRRGGSGDPADLVADLDDHVELPTSASARWLVTPSSCSIGWLSRWWIVRSQSRSIAA